MLVGTSLILLAWFIEMPLWLSITITCLAGVHALGSGIRFLAKCFAEGD